ncbi:MAG: hypothetical protein EBR30_22515 [Cytophagia bacterium]|nr:hypothetical protein [Cytophagia bacterium]NBW37741.1 hypothetical protein [Cytophagia bacterium]
MNLKLRYIAIICAFFGPLIICSAQINSISINTGLGPANSTIQVHDTALDKTELYLNKSNLKPSVFTINLLTDVGLTKKKHFFFQTGLNYSAFGKGDPFIRDVYQEANGASRLVSYRQDYSWFGLPLNFGYHLNKGVIKPYISTGLNLSYFLDRSVIKENYYVYDANNNLTAFGQSSLVLNRRNLQLWNTLTIGADCQAFRFSQLGVTVQAQFANQLTSVWSSMIDEKIMYFTFSFGIKYWLEKPTN